MITLTESAKNQLDLYFSDKSNAELRIYLAAGGCAGPRLALAMDDKLDADESFEVGGYVFLVEKKLLGRAAPLTVDLDDMGFQIRSSLNLRGGCSSGSCSSGSCCG